jgi:hypothetical protein
MKSKEEIEQLAKQLCNIPIDLVINEEERYYKNFQKYDGIIQGYIQCQKDMVDKKYTEVDLENAFNSGKGYGVPDNIKDFNSFINSLNKQD